jgi:choline dehydrogenase
VVAARLAEDEGASVCVLEAGPPDSSPFIHIPAGFMKTFVNPKVNWLYETEPGDGSGGRRIQQPRGKTLGGSGSINGHVYNRGQRLDYDVWAQYGNRGWGYRDVLPYFKRTERRVGWGDDTFRGRDGPFVVTDLSWQHPLLDAFVAGAVGMGIPENADYNGARQEGVARAQRSIHRNRRVSPANAFLHPAMKRGGLEVRTGALVDRIVFEGRRAVGVRYLQGGEAREIRARRELVLSGGVFNSPQLLQRSGVGSPDLLADLGVPVVHAVPGVGEHLRDHYAIRVPARVRDVDTINERARGLRLVGEIVKYFAGRPSILELQPTLVYVFWKSLEALDRSDLQLTFTPASYKENVQSRLDDEPGMTCSAWQQRPESLGYVRARSLDPHVPPTIQPNYLSHETDQRTIVAGARLARRLLRTPELEPYFAGELFPGEQAQSDDELLDAARQRGTTCFHSMGTCRMGPATDPRAVVDDELRVHGIEGLRVADASIMPTMPSANIHAATLMIGEKAADLLRARPAPPPARLGPDDD